MPSRLRELLPAAAASAVLVAAFAFFFWPSSTPPFQVATNPELHPTPFNRDAQRSASPSSSPLPNGQSAMGNGQSPAPFGPDSHIGAVIRDEETRQSLGLPNLVAEDLSRPPTEILKSAKNIPLPPKPARLRPPPDLQPEIASAKPDLSNLKSEILNLKSPPPDSAPFGELLHNISEREAAATTTASQPPPLELTRLKLAEKNGPAPVITFSSDIEGATPLEFKQLAPTHFEVFFTTKPTNWFIFSVKGAKGQTIRIDLKNPQNSWSSLNPVYTYATDLSNPASFAQVPPVSPPAESPTRNSIKSFNGPLLPDTTNQPWHYLPNVWSARGTNALSMVHTFESDQAYLAMRFPYSPSLAQAYIKQLDKNPLARVFTVGQSKEGRPLHIVKIGEGSEEAEKTKPCILLYAREHANEQDTSWVAQGAIDFLLADSDESHAIRAACTFLMIPLLDPDGAGAGKYEGITQKFAPGGQQGSEATAYAAFFKNWVDAGKRLDLSINLHNVETGDQPHLSCPRIEPGDRRRLAETLHALVVTNLGHAGYNVNPKPWTSGFSDFRLGGYLRKFYGPLHMPYEINGQDKQRHLDLSELRRIGETLVTTAPQFLSAQDAASLRASIEHIRDRRSARMNKYEKNLNEKSTGALSVEWGCWLKDIDAQRQSNSTPGPMTVR